MLQYFTYFPKPRITLMRQSKFLHFSKRSSAFIICFNTMSIKNIKDYGSP